MHGCLLHFVNISLSILDGFTMFYKVEGYFLYAIHGVMADTCAYCDLVQFLKIVIKQEDAGG